MSKKTVRWLFARFKLWEWQRPCEMTYVWWPLGYARSDISRDRFLTIFWPFNLFVRVYFSWWCWASSFGAAETAYEKGWRHGFMCRAKMGDRE